MTPDALLRDVIPHHQRPSSSRTATPKMTPTAPLGDALPHHGQHTRRNTTTARPARQVYEQEFALERLVGPTCNQKGILRYRFRWYGCDPVGICGSQPKRFHCRRSCDTTVIWQLHPSYAGLFSSWVAILHNRRRSNKGAQTKSVIDEEF